MTTVKVILGEPEEKVKYYGQGTFFQFTTTIDPNRTRNGFLCKPASGALALIDLNSANRWDEPFTAIPEEKYTIEELEKKLNICIVFVAESAEIILK